MLMYKATTPLCGDKERTQHKRKSSVAIEVKNDASHRFEYNVHTRDRKQLGQPCKILETSKEAHNIASSTQDTIVVETKINELFGRFKELLKIQEQHVLAQRMVILNVGWQSLDVQRVYQEQVLRATDLTKMGGQSNTFSYTRASSPNHGTQH